MAITIIIMAMVIMMMLAYCLPHGITSPGSLAAI